MSRFQEGLQGLHTARRFWVDVREHRFQMGLVCLLQAAVIALSMVQPWPLQRIFDRALYQRGENPEQLIWIASGVLLAIVLGRALIDYHAGLRLTAVGHGVTRNLRLRIFRHLVELPPQFHVRQKSGDLLMRLMGDAPMVSTMMVEASTNLLVRGTQAVVTVALMMWMDLHLTLTLALVLPLLYWVTRFLAGRLTIATRKQRRKEGELADSLQESIGAAEVIQSLGRESEVVRAFARSNRRSARAGLKTAKAAARLGSSVESLLGLALAVTILLGSLRVLDPTSDLSPGQLLVIVSYVRGLLKPVRSASKHQARFAKGLAASDRILEVLDTPIAVRANAGTRPPAARPEHLRLRDVGFRYDDGTRALVHVDAQIHAGQTIALVGPNGAGKSTLISLLMRLSDPTEGAIELDGVALPEYDLDALRERFAVSMQSSVLFGLSVRDNLLLGDPDADENQLWKALERAAADEFVRNLPGGLDEELGSGGASLSGGQRQRLCLARALLRRSPILVADEPFAHLDRAARARVERTLDEHAASGGMVIVVTHDPMGLDSLHAVWRMEQGTLHVAARTGDPTDPKETKPWPWDCASTKSI